MNTQINITENGTTTLATAGKYCDRNIDVKVDVPAQPVSYASFLDGTISGEFVDDKVTALKTAVFQNCVNLTYISLPNCVEAANGSTFNGCEKVQTLDLPKLASLTGTASRVFYGMKKLKEINLPELVTAPNMSLTFSQCTDVERILLPKLGGTSLTQTFYNCYRLHTLVLGGSTLNTLANTNAFTNVGTNAEYAPNGISIYVPDDMVNTYKTATNWTAYADKIKPMSELEG